MPAKDIANLIEVLDNLATAGFAMGSEWEAVHNLCQAHEGDQVFDWGHALCHRIEGDEWNAGYWYRRAGRPIAGGSFAEEWVGMRAALARTS